MFYLHKLVECVFNSFYHQNVCLQQHLFKKLALQNLVILIKIILQLIKFAKCKVRIRALFSHLTHISMKPFICMKVLQENIEIQGLKMASLYSLHVL